MSRTIVYRTGEAPDAAAINAHGRAAFVEAFGPLYAPDEIAGYFDLAYGPGAQAKELADPACTLFLAEDGEGLVGQLKLGPCTLPIGHPAGAAEVKRLYLLGRAQGAGVATTLLAQAVVAARSQGAGDLYLSCWTGNRRALRFYEREGFAIVGAHKFAVGPRLDDDFILHRTL